MLKFSLDVFFVVILAILTLRINFVVKELVEFLTINLVGPPAERVGLVVIDYNFWLFG